MRNLTLFTHLTLDGYYADANGDISWAHRDGNDPEQKAFVEENAGSGGLLLFGRVTYQMMAGYWPTPLASRNDPVVAARMNAIPKVVFSKTLDAAPWNNTTLVKGDLAAEVRRLKAEPGQHITILGSASIAAQLAGEGLIDDYRFVVNPVILGSGRTMFAGVRKRLILERTTTRTFGNGSVLLCYRPKA